MRSRSTIGWEPRDGRLVSDLSRFQARARGRRLKELALLGLVAESRGVRLNEQRTGLIGLPGAAAGVAAPAANDADALSSDHVAGVDRLMGNFD